MASTQVVATLRRTWGRAALINKSRRWADRSMVWSDNRPASRAQICAINPDGTIPTIVQAGAVQQPCLAWFSMDDLGQLSAARRSCDPGRRRGRRSGFDPAAPGKGSRPRAPDIAQCSRTLAMLAHSICSSHAKRCGFTTRRASNSFARACGASAGSAGRS